ncbi:MAG: class I SAM-dependent methyltransferase [Planctomycetes bacterium]|nr:class I SAM-dependent methyltransferase [Planctomycetota bacterium]
MNAPTSTASQPSSVSWERVWRSEPTAAKDATLLARERASKRWALIVERLEATFGSIRSLSAVELGSGRGDLSALLAERGAEVTLVDSCEQALDQARTRFDRLGLAARFEQADFLDPAFARRRRYDISLSSGVIEHFIRDERTRSIRAHQVVLEEHGMAIISVPHAHCPPYRLWKRYLELRGWWPYGVEIPYAKRELVRRAREAGFASTETQCTGLLQSIGSHWVQRLFGVRPAWTDGSCALDSLMGSTLILFGWTKPATGKGEPCRAEIRA